MNGAVALLLGGWLAASGAAWAAPVALDRLERISAAGHEYVRVRDWAQANGLTTTWLQAGKAVRVANGAGNVVLTGDSRTAVVNGIGVWLSFPVLMRESQGFVALADLKTALVPLLFPSKGAGRIRLIALDPGHGGKDKGFFHGSQFEKNYTLALAQEVRKQLLLAGQEATLTRSTDTFVELGERPDIAKRRRADLFVSLHFNSAGEAGNEAQGVEVYCATPVGASSTNARGEGANHGPVLGNLYNDRSVLLAWQLQKVLVTRLGMEDRGVRRARFQVLCEAAMPAVLIEGGFLSHPAERRRIADASFRRRMAKAVVEGILAYKRTVELGNEAPRKRRPS